MNMKSTVDVTDNNIILNILYLYYKFSFLKKIKNK